LTCAENLEKGIEMIEDAKRQWLITSIESGYEILKRSQINRSLWPFWESGLYYLRVRYYDPTIGRFI